MTVNSGSRNARCVVVVHHSKETIVNRTTSTITLTNVWRVRRKLQRFSHRNSRTRVYTFCGAFTRTCFRPKFPFAFLSSVTFVYVPLLILFPFHSVSNFYLLSSNITLLILYSYISTYTRIFRVKSCSFAYNTHTPCTAFFVTHTAADEIRIGG